MNILKALMRSAVMDRSLGRFSKEELEASEKLTEEERESFDIKWYSLQEKLAFDGREIDTGKGKSFLCGLQTEGRRSYKLRFRVKVDASRLAQVPVSIFTNGILQKTITFNGTEGESVEAEHLLGAFFNPNNFLKLYFAEGGMQIEELCIECVE